VRNEELTRRSGIKPLCETVKAKHRGWDWLVMCSDRRANVAMNWIPRDSKRPKGRPQKTWRTTFTDLQGFGVTWRGLKKIANDHGTDGRTSLLDTPMGTGVTKSKQVWGEHGLASYHIMLLIHRFHKRTFPDNWSRCIYRPDSFPSVVWHRQIIGKKGHLKAKTTTTTTHLMALCPGEQKNHTLSLWLLHIFN